MTNYEMKLLLQAGLGIEVSEERAAWILAGVEERLRNVAAQQSVQWILLESGARISTCQTCGHTPVNVLPEPQSH